VRIDDYQNKTADTAGPYLKSCRAVLDRERMTLILDPTEPTLGETLLRSAYLAGKLNGEAGEVAEEVFKALRDDLGIFTTERLVQIMKELGDVMWYVSQLCNELGLSLDDVMQLNLAKLQARKGLGKLQGSGSDR